MIRISPVTGQAIKEGYVYTEDEQWNHIRARGGQPVIGVPNVCLERVGIYLVTGPGLDPASGGYNATVHEGVTIKTGR